MGLVIAICDHDSVKLLNQNLLSFYFVTVQRGTSNVRTGTSAERHNNLDRFDSRRTNGTPKWVKTCDGARAMGSDDS